MSQSIFKELMGDYAGSEGVGAFPISFGFTETGNEIKLSIKRLKHVLITGMSQSGKSTMVKRVLPDLIKYADVSIYTTKSSDFTNFEDTAYTCNDVDEMSAVIRRMVGVIERRNEKLRQQRLAKGPDYPCTDKPAIILIDEFQSFKEMTDTATVLALKRIIREGAGLNVFLYLITQTPNKSILDGGMRDNIMTDVAFKQRDSYGSRMAIGDRKAEFLELHQCIIRNVDKRFTITRFHEIAEDDEQNDDDLTE